MFTFRHIAMAAALFGAAGTAAAQDINGSGTYGTLQLGAGFSDDPRTVQVAAGGSVDSSQTIGGRCRGMIASNPDYTLEYGSGDWPLYLSVDAQADTTLVVYAPDGFYYCDDDSAGDLDPGVYLPKPPAGRYQIWVGTFATNAGTPPATIYISEVNYVHALADGAPQPSHLAQPGANTNYSSVALRTGFTPDPHIVNVRAGGGTAVNQDLAQCNGHVSVNPDFRLDWTGGGSLPLILSVASSVDTTLLVRGPDGAFACDDDGGEQAANPSLRYNSPASGAYEIWVGTFTSEDGGAQAALHISELTSQ